jgi:hypothetical protein
MYYPTFEEEATPMKQTAVEWFANELFSSMVDVKTFNYFDVQKMLEQAKEMEKQQERDACGLALSKLLYKQALKSEISDEEIEKAAEEYVLYNNQKKAWVIEGMKLYREQFKK